MAEQVMVVCDVCGRSPAERVGISAKGQSYQKDLCTEHLATCFEARVPPDAGGRAEHR
jgi:hypothetical protein